MSSALALAAPWAVAKGALGGYILLYITIFFMDLLRAIVKTRI